MKLARSLFFGILAMCLSACESTTDITKNPARMTDFVVGETYQLKKPVWLSHGSLMTLRDREPSDSEGVLGSGERVRIRQVVVFRSPEVGTTTEVYAEVLTGSHKGMTVSVTVISDVLKTGYTKRRPSMLGTVD